MKLLEDGNAVSLRRILTMADLPAVSSRRLLRCNRTLFDPDRPHNRKMSVRLLQNAVGAGNCLFGLILLALYGPALLHIRAWPLGLGQEVLLLVAGSVLPLAVVALRFPLIGGMGQFATAYIGNQLLHEAPLRVLRDFSSVSMAIALAIVLIAVFQGILEITQEAFGEIDDTDEQQAARAA